LVRALRGDDGSTSVTTSTASTEEMTTSDLDIWRAVHLLIKRHGAAARAPDDGAGEGRPRASRVAQKSWRASTSAMRFPASASKERNGLSEECTLQKYFFMLMYSSSLRIILGHGKRVTCPIGS